MRLVVEDYKGVVSEAYRCRKCRAVIFTEEQALAFGKKYQQKLLKEKYEKHPVKIGNSYGMLFPRELVKALNLDSKKTRLEIEMDLAKSKIEITVI
ncbi:hypothetical protein JW711_05045 [Candidatus Woesearchaeota archaeon]|nr:hypothetical protein [Candidatus Woesearchaeota archaeon]